MAQKNKIAIELDADVSKGTAKVKKFGGDTCSAFDNVKSAIDGTNSKLKVSKACIFAVSTATAAVAASTAALAIPLKQVYDQTVQVSASFEAMEIKLNALTKGRGKETLDELNKWALDMPVNTMKAVDTFAMMQAMGLNPTIKKMETLVDVSSMFGEETMPVVARALGQMMTLGKLSAEELNQLAEAGINARKYLKDAFGMGVEELQKSSVGISEIVDAIWKGLDADYSGSAKAAQKSWAGVTAEFKSHLDEIARKGGEHNGAFDGLKESVHGLTEYLQENEEVLVRVAANTVDAASSFIGMARIVAEKVTPAIKLLNEGYEWYVGLARKAGLKASGLDVDIDDVGNIDTSPYETVMTSHIKRAHERVEEIKKLISDTQENLAKLKNFGTAGQVEEERENISRYWAELEKAQQRAHDLEATLDRWKINKEFEEDFNYFVDLLNQADKNLAELQSQFTKTAKMSSIKNYDESHSKLIADLTDHYKELSGEMTEYDRQVKAVDGVIDKYTKKLKAAGVAEEELNRIRKEAHGRVKDILDEQERTADNLRDLQGMFGDNKLFSGIGDGAKTAKSNLDGMVASLGDMSGKTSDIDAFKQSIASLNEELARGAAIGIVESMTGGFDDALNSMRGLFKDFLQDMIQLTLQNSIGDTISQQLMTAFGPQMASSIGALASGGIGIAVGTLMGELMGGGSEGQSERKFKMVLSQLRNIEKNTKENVQTLKAQLSTASNSHPWGGSIADATVKYQQKLSDLSEALDKVARYRTSADDDLREKWDKAWSEYVGAARSARVEFLTQIQIFKSDVQKNIKDLWQSVLDANTTSYEKSRSDIDRNWKDALLGTIATTRNIGGNLIGESDPLYAKLFESADTTINDIIASITTDINNLRAGFDKVQESQPGKYSSFEEYIQTAYHGAYSYLAEFSDIVDKYTAAVDSSNTQYQDQRDIIMSDVGTYMAELRGEGPSETEKAVNAIIERFKEYEKQLKDVTGVEVDLSKEREEAIAITEKLAAEEEQRREEARKEAATKVYADVGAYMSDLRDESTELEKAIAAIKERFSGYEQQLRDTGEAEADLSKERDEAIEITRKLYEEETRLKETARKAEIDRINTDLSTYLSDLRNPLSDVEKAVRDVNSRFDEYEKQLIDQKAVEVDLSSERAEAIALTRALYTETGELADETEGLTDNIDSLRDSMESAAKSVYDMQDNLSFLMSGMSKGDWAEKQFQELWATFMKNGALTGDEFSRAVGHVSDWYNEELRVKQEIVNSWKQVATTIGSLKNSITSTISSIKYGSLNLALPQHKADAAAGDYATMYNLAKTSGTEAAVSQYLSFAQQYLQMNQDAYKSGPKYIAIYDQVMADMESLLSYIGTDDYASLMYKTNQSIADETRLTNVQLAAISDKLSMYNDSLQTIMAVSTGGVPFVSQSIPKYAKGGIVYHRQIAEVGEDGLEGIVPLEGGAIPVRFTGGGSNRPISINVKIGNREIKDFIIETTDDVNAKVNRRGGYPGRV